MHRLPAASWNAHECSRVVVTPFFWCMQPFPDVGLAQMEPRLYVMQTGSVALLTASLTLNLMVLGTGAAVSVLVLRDDAVGAFSRRDASERVLDVTRVWLQYSGISDAL